jgi:trigger factor
MADKEAKKAKVDVVETKPCSITLNVEVPHSEVLNETEAVYRKLQSVAQVPGFRPGKSPMELVKKNFAGKAKETVIENLIQQTVFSSLKAHGVAPISYPVIEEVCFDFDKPFTYRMKAERHPEFKVKDYKGAKVNKEIREITDASADKRIDDLRERNARLEEAKSGMVSETSFVTADLNCFLDAEPVAELSAKDQLFDLSSPQSLKGFKEGFLGMKKGEEKEIKIAMPQEYPNKKIAGKEVTFKAKVNEIKEKVLPQMDDEFAKDLGLTSIAELREKIKEVMVAEEKKHGEEETDKQIIEHLLKNNVFPVPDSLIEEQLDYLVKRMERYYIQQGGSKEDWAKKAEEMRPKYREEAEKNVRLSYILNSVATEEKLEVNDKDISDELDRVVKANADKEDEVKKYFNDNKGDISARLKEQKIFEFLVKEAKIKETKTSV